MAAWQGPTAQYPSGCIEIALDHQVIQSQIQYWRGHYPASVANDVEKIVKDVYEEIAIAKVSQAMNCVGIWLERNAALATKYGFC